MKTDLENLLIVCYVINKIINRNNTKVFKSHCKSYLSTIAEKVPLNSYFNGFEVLDKTNYLKDCLTILISNFDEK